MGDAVHAWADPSRSYNAATDFVDRNVEAGRADKPVFVDPAKTLTYGQLQNHMGRFANGLRRLGVQPEQRVALIMFDTVAMPVAFWGALKAGIVPVPLNTLLSGEQYHYILADCRAVALVVSAGLLDKVEPILSKLPHLRHVVVDGTRVFPCSDSNGGSTSGTPDVDETREFPSSASIGSSTSGTPDVDDGATHGDTPTFEALLTENEPEAPTADTVADEVAFWLYSSGSTGMPKGVRHRHSSLMATARHYGQQVLGIREDDVCYSAAKIFFAYGLGNAMSFPMSVGATTILLPDRPTPAAVTALMRQHEPTLFFGVPTLFTAMLASPELGSGAGSRRLRLCVSAGEALPREVGERWKARVGVDILDGIGSTEMLHIFLSNRPGEIRYGSSGRPVPGYDARVVAEDGTEAADGEIGELLINGPSAGDDYWNQRAKSVATFVGPWTHTGDKYRREADGYYYYCGRTDDMFKVSGNWVSPFDVESALMTHRAVLEAAVVGFEDDDGLVKPKAFVVLNDGVEPSEALFSELKEHVKKAGGPWKYPRWIEVRDELPKTATGKIQRFKLRGKGAG